MPFKISFSMTWLTWLSHSAIFQITMGRRLEKFYLFCNTAFLSLFTFTMKFVRLICIRQNTL